MPLATDFGPLIQRDEPLAPHTWFRLGGAAQYFAQPETLEQLGKLVRRCREENIPVRLLGGGSNVLVRDEGVRGLVIKLGGDELSKIDVAGTKVTTGAAAKLGHVITHAVGNGLGGLETLVGIPGTIGGALHGNAGSRSGDIGQWLLRATVMTHSGEILERRREELTFAYRQSGLDELVILGAEFQLESDDPEALTKRMQKQWILKKSTQPLGHQSAGCIFKNPRGMSAGMLIDQAGLKGTHVGGAIVSERHANFIVAEEGAKAADVLALMEMVRGRVAERLGVELETEIDVW
ncbi:MAG: UDP-N-acetylmuramate dehydrogenase [Planctomycetes bacterium]|nr:UDP-N-acetylmuramate dehydrogenase [Planctomycetota bacterium]